MKKTREIRSVKDDAERLMQVIRQNAGASISEIAALLLAADYARNGADLSVVDELTYVRS